MTSKRTLRSQSRCEEITKVSMTDRFEKLIEFVSLISEKSKKDSEGIARVKKPFKIPNEILRRLANDRSESNHQYSPIEYLPMEILVQIFTQLSGNDQVITALTCRTFARIVDGTDSIKLANISHYNMHTWKEYLAIRLEGAPDPYWNLTETVQDLGDSVYGASYSQFTELRARVQDWLGRNYFYCEICWKFRIKDKKWWRAFAEYDTPGITKVRAKSKEVTTLINKWMKTSVRARCPAHGLLFEFKGKRVIGDESAPAWAQAHCLSAH